MEPEDPCTDGALASVHVHPGTGLPLLFLDRVITVEDVAEAQDDP